MKIDRSPTGKIIQAIKGYKAFIPNELLPDLKWDDRVVGLYQEQIICLESLPAKEIDKILLGIEKRIPDVMDYSAHVSRIAKIQIELNSPQMVENYFRNRN